MKKPKNEQTRLEYEKRINTVINYINEHIHEQMMLEELADVACFSKYHFHRIFNAFLGETVYTFIRRLRLEKAFRQLVFDRTKSVTDIAFDCGFSSSQNFAKAFRIHFDMTPTQVRDENDFRDEEFIRSKFGNTISNQGNTDSNEGKDTGAIIEGENSQKELFVSLDSIVERNEVMDVAVKEMPVFHVAYVRHIGKYDTTTIGPTFETLFRWAGPRGLIGKGTEVLGVSWDNPKITPEEKLRYDACVTVDQSVEADGPVALQDIPGGLFAVYRTEVKNGGNPDFQKPWVELMRDWLPDSGYQPDDKPCYEMYHNDVADDPEGVWDVSICLPVKPM